MMNPIRALMLGGIVAAGGFFGIALVLPSQFTAKKELEMQASQKVVFTHINYIRNWKTWAFSGYQTAGDSTFVFGGESSGVGALAEWKLPQANGRLEITKAEGDSLVELRMLTNQGEFESKITFHIQALDSARSLVQCEETGDVGFHLTARYFVALGGLQKSVQEKYGVALAELKKLSEEAQAAKKFKCH